MAGIFYELDDFTYPLPTRLVRPRDGRHRVPMNRLVWAAATVGSPARLGPRGRGRDHALELQWRAAMIRASVRPGPHYFYRSRSYERLDPSEKSAVSFFLGQVQAKVFAHDFFHVGLFVHYDRYLEYLGAPRARTRPDFLGFRGRRAAIAVEAKGRSRYWQRSVMQAAKKQAQSIPAIVGHPVPTRYAQLAYFDGDEWRAHLQDPPSRNTVPPADPAVLTLAYYHPIVAAIRTRQAGSTWINGVRYLRAPFDDVDGHLLVRADIAELVPGDKSITSVQADVWSASGRLYEFALELDEDSTKSTVGQGDASTQEDEPIFVGNDGVGVELGPSWQEWRTPEDE